MPLQPPIIRAYRPTDNANLEHLVSVLRANAPSLQAADYVAIDAQFRNHDPLTDRFVLEQESEIIGYAWLAGDRLDRNDCWLCVAPRHRREGYGTRLLEAILTRASQRSATGIMTYLPGQPPALEFADQAGLAVKGYAFDFLLPASTPQSQIALPSGWRLEPYSESSDVARYAAVLNASYADLWGHGMASIELAQMMLSTLDPRDVFFVTDGDGLDIGCAGIRRGTTQSIDAPGLIKTHRSPENYQAILSSALTILEPDLDVALSSWGDHENTLLAYRQLGFVETERTPIAWRAV